jgi:23S rRNA-/tRNA-specific pseudouridylate synthase
MRVLSCSRAACHTLVRCPPLHRLDQDTSGVLLAAKDAATASAVNAQFRAKSVAKAYLAM